MKSQITNIKGRFGLARNLSTELASCNEVLQQEEDHHDYQQQDMQRHRSVQQYHNGGVYSQVTSQLTSPCGNIQENPSNLMSAKNLVSSYSQFHQSHLPQNNFTKQNEIIHEEAIDGGFSPPDPKYQNRRATENFQSLERNDMQNEQKDQRRILSSMNLHTTQNENAPISNSSQFKFTNTSYACSPTTNHKTHHIISPQSYNRYGQQNINITNVNKENYNSSNSPIDQKQFDFYSNNNRFENQRNNHSVGPSSLIRDDGYEHKYQEQIKLNKQLIDQVKTLKSKIESQKEKQSTEIDVRIIKAMQNEEFLQQKVQQLEQDNITLQNEVFQLSSQIEGSMRNNQELEVYLENFEVSEAQFTDKQKNFNRKIQDLNNKNAQLRDQNIVLEDRIKLLESDKQKLSEKWIRLSARQRVEERNKSKAKQNEQKCDQQEKDITNLKNKFEVSEREASILKEDNEKMKKQLKEQATYIKVLESKYETIEREKSLADKVTNELLQRIQRYEIEINELSNSSQQQQMQIQQSLKDSNDLRLFEQDMQQMQAKMDQMNHQSLEIQTYNQELERDNAKLLEELQISMNQSQIKDQQIESLNLQVEHQIEQYKEMQQEFQQVIEQFQKKQIGLNFKFNDEELQQACDFLMTQIEIDESQQLYEQYQDGTDDQTVSCLIIKAAQKVKFMNKYIEALKKEMEEITEKYDRLALKFRDITKNSEHLQNVSDVLQAQKDNCDREIIELKNYISELENIVKNGGQGTQQINNHFQETFQATNDHHHQSQEINQPPLQIYERSPSIMNMYTSVQTDPGQQCEEFDDPIIYSSMNSQQARTFQTLQNYNQQQLQSVQPSQVASTKNFLDRVQTYNRKNYVNNISSVQQSYDHSRICLPTRLIQQQQSLSLGSNSSSVENRLSANQSVQQVMNSQDKSGFSLQEQIKNTLQNYKKQQVRGSSNTKSGRKSSIIIKSGDQKQRQIQNSLNRSPFAEIPQNTLQQDNQQYLSHRGPQNVQPLTSQSINSLALSSVRQSYQSQLPSGMSSGTNNTRNSIRGSGFTSGQRNKVNNISQQNRSQY